MARAKIDHIKVGTDQGVAPFSDFAWVQSQDGELYYLWWDDAFPEETTAAHHVRRSMWIGMVRDALSHGLEVDFVTESASSSKVVTVVVFGA
jgi:hypothetical protein